VDREMLKIDFILQLVDKPDQLFPLFVMQVMGDIPCIPGEFRITLAVNELKLRIQTLMKIF
jgi:hypothetical protein